MCLCKNSNECDFRATTHLCVIICHLKTTFMFIVAGLTNIFLVLKAKPECECFAMLAWSKTLAGWINPVRGVEKVLFCIICLGESSPRAEMSPGGPSRLTFYFFLNKPIKISCLLQCQKCRLDHGLFFFFFLQISASNRRRGARRKKRSGLRLAQNWNKTPPLNSLPECFCCVGVVGRGGLFTRPKCRQKKTVEWRSSRKRRNSSSRLIWRWRSWAPCRSSTGFSSAKFACWTETSSLPPPGHFEHQMWFLNVSFSTDTKTVNCLLQKNNDHI